LSSGVSNCLEIDFAADHPTAAGHFPGNPVLPGALLLDAVLIAVTSRTGGKNPAGASVRSVKFLRAVRPGSRLRIVWDVKGEDIQFTCSIAETGETAMTGALRLGDDRT
jgi:3-hydroxymyristoyl/3-hydroxydecanoyl-(acyl carrier protein) dehydratase